MTGNAPDAQGLCVLLVHKSWDVAVMATYDDRKAGLARVSDRPV
jgi:hypothetical protein